MRHRIYGQCRSCVDCPKIRRIRGRYPPLIVAHIAHERVIHIGRGCARTTQALRSQVLTKFCDALNSMRVGRIWDRGRRVLVVAPVEGWSLPRCRCNH